MMGMRRILPGNHGGCVPPRIPGTMVGVYLPVYPGTMVGVYLPVYTYYASLGIPWCILPCMVTTRRLHGGTAVGSENSLGSSPEVPLGESLSVS